MIPGWRQIFVLLNVGIIGIGAKVPGVQSFPEERPGIYGALAVLGPGGGYIRGDYEKGVPDILRACQEAGVTQLRVELAWKYIEEERGRYDWKDHDLMLNAIHDSGIGVLVYVGTAPRWATDSPDRAVEILQERGQSNLIGMLPILPEYWEDYERYLRATVRRYREQIDWYEVWNEPDGMAGLRVIRDASGTVIDVQYGGDSEWYAELLRRTYPIIKEEDPGSLVAGGSMQDRSNYENDFFEKVYQLGANRYFDAVAVHSYGTPLNFDWIYKVRRQMIEYGDGHKPVWLTEWGMEGHQPEQLWRTRGVLRYLRETPWITMANVHTFGHLCGWNPETETLYLEKSAKLFRKMREETGPRRSFAADFESGEGEWYAQSDLGPRRCSQSIEIHPGTAGHYLHGRSPGREFQHVFQVYVRDLQPVVRCWYRVKLPDPNAHASLYLEVRSTDIGRPQDRQEVVSPVIPGDWSFLVLPFANHFNWLRGNTVMTLSVGVSSNQEGVELDLDDFSFGPK